MGLTLAQSLLLAAAVALLAMMLYSHLGQPHRALCGYWAGDEEFKAEAGLADIILWVEPAERSVFGAPTHPAFLVASTEEGVVCSQPCAVSVDLGRGFWGRDAYEAPAALAFDEPAEAVWPAAVTLTLRPADGTLAVRDGDTLYALFRKVSVDPPI